MSKPISTLKCHMVQLQLSKLGVIQFIRAPVKKKNQDSL